jgi:glycosyltransferase involved in cell wall biosynthesis
MPTTSFPRDERDSAGRFVLDLAVRLVDRGHTVEVLAPEPHEGRMPALPEGVSLRWVSYLRPRRLQRTFYGAGVLDNLGSPLAWPGLGTFPLALATVMHRRASEWDAVVSHWALPCGLLASRTGLPHAALVHSGDAHLLSRLPRRDRWARSIASGAHLFASSKPTRATLLSCFAGSPPDVDVLPMGSDEPTVADAEREAARRELGVDGLVVLSIARLVPIKGIERTIDAVASTSNATLALAGDGPLRSVLMRRAAAIDARFLGSVDRTTLRRWLAASDVVVLASSPLADGRTEGAPVSISEALGAGIPVIASATGGVSDLVQDGVNGLLVAPGDGGALTRALQRFARDRALSAHLRAGARHHRPPSMRDAAARLERALDA